MMRKLLLVAIVLTAPGCGDRGAPADVPPNAATGLPTADSLAVPQADTAAPQADSVMARDTATVW